MNDYLARRTDPATSLQAAQSLDLTLNRKHEQLLRIVGRLGRATDDEIADAAVKTDLTQRHEQARRLLRTVRDKTNYVQPARDEHGEQIRHVNSSGRQAYAWELSQHGRVAVRSW
tara:strand:+ start:11547 stop:11891 length:345 start_codon:yes stop_codon:yes gene_type:complete